MKSITKDSKAKENKSQDKNRNKKGNQMIKDFQNINRMKIFQDSVSNAYKINTRRTI